MLKVTLGNPPPAIDTRVLVEVPIRDGDTVRRTWFLRVPTPRDRMRRDRMITEAGLSYHTDRKLFDAVRRFVRERVVEDQVADLLDLVDRYSEAEAARFAAMAEWAERVKTAKDEAEIEAISAERAAAAALAIDADLAADWARLQDEVRRSDAGYRRMLADRSEYLTVLPWIDARILLERCDDAEMALDRSNGLVTEESLFAMPEADRAQVTAAALIQFSMSEDDRKNSASPSASSTGRGISTKTSSDRTPKTTPGKSEGESIA